MKHRNNSLQLGNSSYNLIQLIIEKRAISILLRVVFAGCSLTLNVAGAHQAKIDFSQVWSFTPSPEKSCESVAETYSRLSSRVHYEPVQRQFRYLIGNKWITESCSDGQNLTWPERIISPDMGSMFQLHYPFFKVKVPVKMVNFDPARVRVYNLLAAVYGENEDQVEVHLQKVNFLNQEIRFNGQAGAAAALDAVGKELMQKISKDPELERFLAVWIQRKINLKDYTFKWRNIAGTNRLSVHSYGVAIDLYDSDKPGPTYWAWDYAKQKVKEAQRQGRKLTFAEVMKNLKEENVKDYTPQDMVKVPWSLVEIFERHGFVWGGKWFHFDAMHFEYRPEFMDQSRGFEKL